MIQAYHHGEHEQDDNFNASYFLFGVFFKMKTPDNMRIVIDFILSITSFFGR